MRSNRRRRRRAAGSAARSSTTTSSSTRRPQRWSSRTSSSRRTNPQVAIVASFATFGVGYVARPIGAFVLGHWGDTHGRKNVLVLCMLLMGGSTFVVALLPTYSAIGIWAPILLVLAAADPGLRGRRRDLRGQRHDPGTRAVRPAWLLRQLHAAGRAGRADHRGRRVPAAVGCDVDGRVRVVGLADPVPAERGGGRSPATSSGAASTRLRRSRKRPSTARCRPRRS